MAYRIRDQHVAYFTLTFIDWIEAKLSRKFVNILLSICCIFFMQSCAEMRINDNKAKKEFAKHKASFESEYYKIQHRTLHYVITGRDSFPTLIFIHGSPGNWDVFKEYMVDSSLQQHYRMISVDRPGFGYSDFGKAMNLSDQSSLISEALEH